MKPKISLKTERKKLNLKIQHYFDGSPYSDGIVRVDIKFLFELFTELNISEEIKEEKALRLARTLWSSGTIDRRQKIVDFFSDHNFIYIDDEKSDDSFQIELKLNSLLDELEVFEDDRVELFSVFKNKKVQNITLGKLQYQLKSLKKEKSAEEEKEKLKIQQQDFRDNFVKNIQHPHRYLNHIEMSESLQLSNMTNLKYPKIKEKYLKRIVTDGIVFKKFEVFKTKARIQVQTTITLPHLEEPFEYILYIDIEINYLLNEIWKYRDLEIKELVLYTKEMQEFNFLERFHRIVKKCREYASVLDVDNTEVYKTIYGFLLKKITLNLGSGNKIETKVIKLFVKSLKDEVNKKHRKVLLARTIRDFENLFPLARTMKRKLILHIGPTNSGKTYNAMQKLKDADTGYYLAPLRLLALEGYEELKENSVAVSLITGEEEIVNEEASHISSTIEMLNFEVDVDVCVIDEVQMIDDRDRGWAWANAIIGVPAHEVIMTGSPNSKDAIIALAKYLGEELEIIEFERKNSLNLNESITKESEVEDATAIIAFSRKDVLKLKKDFLKSLE